MSTLNTFSVFYFNTNVTKSNNAFDFNEGGPELTAYVEIDDYTLTDFALALENALNAAGAFTYTVAVNRTTRVLTISATGSFAILGLTGSHVGTGVFSTAGFSAIDLAAATSHASQNGAGSEYRPQLKMDEYTAPEDWEVKESAVVSMSSSGVVQTVQYGDGQRMQCNIRGASNLTGFSNCYDYFFENATGLNALRIFMRYLITKSKIEFMPDEGDRSTFYSMLLESTNKDSKGTSFMIKNMDGANKYYETCTLVFRKVIES